VDIFGYSGIEMLNFSQIYSLTKEKMKRTLIISSILSILVLGAFGCQQKTEEAAVETSTEATSEAVSEEQTATQEATLVVGEEAAASEETTTEETTSEEGATQ
jgi:hypothetical protein